MVTDRCCLPVVATSSLAHATIFVTYAAVLRSLTGVTKKKRKQHKKQKNAQKNIRPIRHKLPDLNDSRLGRRIHAQRMSGYSDRKSASLSRAAQPHTENAY